MIELPEALTLAKQIREALAGRVVADVCPPTKARKFIWFAGDPADYAAKLAGATLVSAAGFGIYAELRFDNGLALCINDSVSPLLCDENTTPTSYQLLITFTSGQALAFNVSLYGGIVLHDESYDDPYYGKSASGVSPLSEDFPSAYERALAACKPSLSAKAFIATEQRFPGVGNGVCQEILFEAGLHPKRKLSTFSDADHARLRAAIPDVLRAMTERGGRDTEVDLFGAPGGYQTRMSRNTYPGACPRCGAPIIKETYLGGSVYDCPVCQPLVK